MCQNNTEWCQNDVENLENHENGVNTEKISVEIAFKMVVLRIMRHFKLSDAVDTPYSVARLAMVRPSWILAVTIFFLFLYCNVSFGFSCFFYCTVLYTGVTIYYPITIKVFWCNGIFDKYQLVFKLESK